MHEDDSSRREPPAPQDSSAPEVPPTEPLAEFEEATVISDQAPLSVDGESDVDFSTAKMSPADLGRALLGQRLAHYELREFVGGGGMGAVFRAHDTQLDRTVAVKILSRDEGADGEMLRRFRNEAQSAARLDHDYIARVYFFGEDRGLHYIVFEFIEGTNVRDMVARTGPLSIEQALSYTIQVTEALNHAHGRSVVHRDIKPSNIIITAEGRAKLVDMGLARLHQVQRPDDDLTASGVTLGTFDYISPEQARDPRNADVRSDIYSLGCTLYYMLTGRPPFPEGTVLQKLLQHQGDEAPDPRELNPDIPDDLWNLMRRMLAKDPRKRYQEPRPLLIDLVPIANQYGIHLNGGSGVGWQLVEPPAPSFLDRHVAWIVPVVLLLVATVVAQFVPLKPAELPPSRRTVFRDSSLSALSVGDQSFREAPENESTPVFQIPEPSLFERMSPGSNEANPFDQRRDESTGTRSPPRGESNSDDASQEISSEAEAVRGSDRVDDADDSDTSGGFTTPNSDNSSVPFERDSRDSSSTDSTSSANEPAATNSPAELEPTLDPSSSIDDDRTSDDLFERNVEEELRTNDEEVPDDSTIRIVDQRSRATGSEVGTSTAPGLLVVDPSESGTGIYDSLSAACQAASSGDVVELKFNGKISTNPIALRDINLTIRAGVGYRPIVNYQPSPPRGAAPRRSMFSLNGGRLTLVGVEFEMQLPADVPSDSWSVVEISNAEAVQLERCTLTVTQTLDDPAIKTAFFRLDQSPILLGGDNQPKCEIDLQDCIARGEADLLRLKGTVPLTLQWSNGLLATNRRLLEVTGVAMQNDAAAVVDIELNHVTAFMREGLCLMNDSQEWNAQSPLKIRVTNSILIVDSAEPLIEQQGVMRAAELRKFIEWRGDRNFYEGFETFWQIYGLDQDNQPQKLTNRTWQSFWGGGEDNLPNYRRVGWKTPLPLDRPFNTHTPEDYSLDDGPMSASSALNAASDGYNAGLRADRLPEPNAEDGIEGEAIKRDGQ